jgi:hypothetical protein
MFRQKTDGGASLWEKYLNIQRDLALCFHRVGIKIVKDTNRTYAKKPGFYEKSSVWYRDGYEETGFLISGA